MLKIAKTKGTAAVVPSVASVHDKSYPISRPLFMYTPGDPSKTTADYLAWILGPEGQRIVQETGYIPIVQ